MAVVGVDMPREGFLAGGDVAEGEQLAEQLAVIVAFYPVKHLDTAAGLPCLVEDILGHRGVGAQGVFGDGCRQHHPLKGAASAEGHIHLPGGER